MSYSVKPGSIFGRIGTELGRGLAESIPKEAERTRLAKGLEDLSNKKGLSQFQKFAGLASQPGTTPQIIQSGSELLRQEARGNALNQRNQSTPNPFKQQQPPGSPSASGVPSITKEEPLSKIQEGYIPPTQEEIFDSAGKMYNANPELYGNDPQKAIEAAETSALRDEKINEAYQKQHANLDAIQKNVVDRLSNHSKNLGVQIPANLYSKIEDEAIQATKPRKDGGGGLTEQQAMKEYGKKLDAASRDYEAINSIGSWSGVVGTRPSEIERSISGLQENFAKRGDTENFADKLISDINLSPMYAYARAEPVSKVPDLARTLRSIPTIRKTETIAGSAVGDRQTKKTLDISEKIANSLGKKGSPLAVAYELEKKGYDPRAWLDYLKKHRDELGLTEAQGRQVNKKINEFGTLSDWWLSAWSGLE